MAEDTDISNISADEEIENELNHIYASIDKLANDDNVDSVIEEAKETEIKEETEEKAEETVQEDVQETIETPVNEETDEVQNAEEEVNEQDAVDEIIEEIESSGKKSIGSLNEVEEETVSEEEAKAALDAFSSDEITPIEDTGAIPEIDDEPEIDEKPQPFENYFHVNREDPHNTDETISLIPEDDEDEDEEEVGTIDNSPLNFSQWLGTICILLIPILNIIMLIVWSSGKGNENRVNYSRALLIVIGVLILFSLSAYWLFNSFFNDFLQDFNLIGLLSI